MTEKEKINRVVMVFSAAMNGYKTVEYGDYSPRVFVCDDDSFIFGVSSDSGDHVIEISMTIPEFIDAVLSLSEEQFQEIMMRRMRAPVSME